MSFVLEQDTGEQFISIPLSLAFIKMNSPAELNTVIEKLIEHYKIPLAVDKYKEVAYGFWAQSPQDGLQPLYGFLDDYLFVGNSASLLKRVIDNRLEGKSLMQHPAFSGIDPGVSEQNNSVTCFDNVEMINLIERFIMIAGTLIVIEDREVAHKIQVISKQIINPFLDGVKMYEKSCTRSYFSPEMVIIDSKTSIAADAYK